MKTRRVAQSLEDLPKPAEIASMSGLEFIQRIVAGEIAAPPMGETLQFRMSHAEAGEVRFEGTPNFGALNPIGTVHGGWFGAILDSCMACAVQTMLKAGQGYTTQEYKVNVIRPLFTDSKDVVAIGRVQHIGRRTAVAIGELRGIEDDKLYATGSTTCLVFDI